MRRWLLALALLLGPVLPAGAMCAEATPATKGWPLWQTFAERNLQSDGRLIDFQSAQMHSTSEGQAYGMFFALVANDRAAFDRMLAWTDVNLAGGMLGARLPAWQWNTGQGVIDANSAADADLWLAYVLIEAGRLWHAPALAQRGLALLNVIAKQEVLVVAGLGPVLLPGTIGFVSANGQVRLNPSYSPLPVLRRLAMADSTGPWKALAETSTRLIAESAPRGMVADWVIWQPELGFVTDENTHAIGGYDAIRVYLWLGMSSQNDAMARRQGAILDGPSRWLAEHAELPEKIDTVDGSVSGSTAPPGFYAAILPYLKSRGDLSHYTKLRTRIQGELQVFTQRGASTLSYYDLVLSLFGFGWSDGRFHFSPQGVLETRWEQTCRFTASHSH